MTLKEFKHKYPCEYFNTDWLTEPDFKNHIIIYFKDWFDKHKFKYDEYYFILIKNFSNFFDVWWDESKEWDSDKYSWEDAWAICDYLPNKFDIWWGITKKPNWWDTDFAQLLGVFLPTKFTKWWPVLNRKYIAKLEIINEDLLTNF